MFINEKIFADKMRNLIVSFSCNLEHPYPRLGGVRPVLRHDQVSEPGHEEDVVGEGS